MKNIGEIIKEKRLRRNLTQAELATLLHITPQAVSRWEMGVSFPDIAMIPEISKVLWVTADELLSIWPAAPEQTEQNQDEKKEEILSQSQIDSIFDYVPGSASGESKRVLVVDDSDFMRMMLDNILARQGHTIRQAKDGMECLDILHSEAVDVCVLDIVMPGMDGIETLRQIRQEQPELKVVMLSARGTEETVRQTLELGADSFVVKPFGEQCLLERIEQD